MCSRLQFQRRRLRVLQAGSAGPTSQTPNLLRLNVTDPSILHSSPASAGARARPPQVARIQRRHAGGRLRGGAHAGGARSGGVKGRAADLGQKRVCRVGFTHQVIQKPLTFRLMTLTNLPPAWFLGGLQESGIRPEIRARQIRNPESGENSGPVKVEIRNPTIDINFCGRR